MALMAAAGEITPMPTCAIFADTASEPRKVYEWLAWLETQLPFPVHRTMKVGGETGLRGNILRAIDGGTFAGAPFFTESDLVGGGRLRRQCTREFKIEPIIQQTRRLLGIAKGERAPNRILVVSWIGISTDEASRMKPSNEHYIEKRHPLIDLNMSRQDCIRWVRDRFGKTPPKSSCTFCPYHDDALWRDMKLNDPESWADAVDIDTRIRNGVRGTTQKLYLHRSMKPLAEVDLRNAEDAGQTSMFDEECEGMCGQ
jgi:hypothetical protein